MSAMDVYLLKRIDRLECRIHELEDTVMSFQDDLNKIIADQQAAREALAKATADAQAAIAEADAAAADAANAKAQAAAAAQQDVAQDSGIAAADAKAQQALDEIAALTAALANNPAPTP